MSAEAKPLSENEEQAVIHLLADELAIPANTVAWISASIGTLASRKTYAHSNAREVCAALLRDLNEFYDGDIETGLRWVKISCSEDVGRVVWGLVSKHVITTEAQDSPSQFDGIFHIDDLDRFLANEGIKRKRISLSKCKRYVSWTFYVVGTAVVVSSYGQVVSYKLAWIGWTIGMIGYALTYLPDPKRKRF